ncbi:hypothetical protein FRC08_007052, partial [Ceratobasidium sp. 394]
MPGALSACGGQAGAGWWERLRFGAVSFGPLVSHAPSPFVCPARFGPTRSVSTGPRPRSGAVPSPTASPALVRDETTGPALPLQ